MTRLSNLLHAALLALAFSAPAHAEGGVPVPQLPAAKGEQCVEDTALMRRNHMEYLKNHRDATMRDGVRTTQYSLKECLECHAEPEQTAAADKNEGQHFCKSCHMYAGVRIDCFECHASRPEANTAFHPIITPGMRQAKAAHRPAEELLNQLAGAGEQSGGNE